MPNWCDNSVTIRHDDPAKLVELKQAVMDKRFLASVIPVPADLFANNAGYFADEELEAQRVAQEEANKALYGYGNWYDFCVNKWGTKWDVEPYNEPVLDGNTLKFEFQSAWAPPIGVYEQLVENGFSVTAYYNETGMAYCGAWVDYADDYFEYGGLNSGEVRELLPDDLNDLFGISEMLSDYEEDE